MSPTIDKFNPDVEVLSEKHRDFLCKFNAGVGFENFNDFLNDEAEKYNEEGNGVTYLIFNRYFDEEKNAEIKELVAFYTLAATSIPYIDRIRIDSEETDTNKYDQQTMGIPALEIKMFAVDCKFQDKFFEYEGQSLPIAAWILRMIINTAEDMIHQCLGFKALFLHSVPSAEEFYRKNSFNEVAQNMIPLHDMDSEFTAMYCSLRDVIINYDE